MSKQENIENQQRFGEAVNSGNLDAIQDVMTTGVVDHDPAPGQGPGPAGFIEFFTKLRIAFPDLKVSVDYMVADEENVAIAYTLTGTLGVKGSGRRVSARGLQIARFENGKIAERWGSSDELGILKQIGAAPSKAA